MVTATANRTWIKDHLNITTNLLAEALDFQGVGFNDLDESIYYGHKLACSPERNTGGDDKGFNASSIKEARLAVSVCVSKYYEDVGHPIDTNVMEWGQIKHINYLIKIQ